ncbi:MAG: 3-deoxy-manno-octulosonate cytidylyltransferase [Opitutaceae bacterium]|nr:3-deoxy-manno-octulosonate cytidylyltransferase [Cytophagales bacterium]
MNVIGIIPARFASSRFPGKMLAEIHGKTMLRRVYEQCLKSKLLNRVIIATDDERIRANCELFSAEVIMTSQDHPSGTDRCYEAFQKINQPYDFIINIQGDEPFIRPEQIDMLISGLKSNTELSTLIKKIDNNEILFGVGNVKVTFNTKNEALYFSRSVIPFLRNFSKDEWLENHDYYEHVGLYAYRADILKLISTLQTSKLEVAESLEQLRWLENGYKIEVLETPYDSFCVETPEDLITAEKLFQQLL